MHLCTIRVFDGVRARGPDVHTEVDGEKDKGTSSLKASERCFTDGSHHTQTPAGVTGGCITPAHRWPYFMVQHGQHVRSDSLFMITGAFSQQVILAEKHMERR